MNTKTLLLGAAASIALAGPVSAAHSQGWYAGLEGGVNWVQKVDVDAGNTTFSTTNFSANLNTGWALLGTVGYDFGTVRAEFEAGYRENDVSSFTVGGAPVSMPTNDSLDEITLMANVLIDVPMPSNLALTFGGGLGADEVTLNIAAAPGGSASDWSFAYQGIAGLSYSLPGTRWDLTMMYRYLVVDDATLTFSPTLAITTDNITKHAVTVGFRYDFAAPPPP